MEQRDHQKYRADEDPDQCETTGFEEPLPHGHGRAAHPAIISHLAGLGSDFDRDIGFVSRRAIGHHNTP
jgi:hypothetical protein